MEVSSDKFLDSARAALLDSDKAQRRDSIAIASSELRKAEVDKFEGFGALRRHIKRIRQHTLDNLAYYLEKFEQEAIKNGNHVHFAQHGSQLNDIVLNICRQHAAKKVIKGKSMITEETKLNEFLKQENLDVTETDLGEYIIELAGETPSHIVEPALHKSADDIRELFLEKHTLGDRDLQKTENLVSEARTVLRDYFLTADIGIIGSNALIAENGYSMLVTNEGNGDLCANLPDVLIICTSIDRVLPRAEDATAMLRLLVRSATGQPQTCYTSFYSGPRKDTDIDGPIETHFVLLDNRRSDILTSRYREMLECIRCGACLNHCPIYTSVGGHAYGSVYQGPMGSVLTPLLTSLEKSSALSNACTTCGRCAEVCPADIPLPALLRDLRQEESDKKLTPRRWRLGLKLHCWLARHPRTYHLITGLAITTLHLAGRSNGRLSRLPMASGWTSQRDFPAPESRTFMHQYKSRLKTKNGR